MISESKITERLAEEIATIESTYNLLQRYPLPEPLRRLFTMRYKRCESKILLLSWILETTPKYIGKVDFFCSNEIDGVACLTQCQDCIKSSEETESEIKEMAYCKECLAVEPGTCICEN